MKVYQRCKGQPAGFEYNHVDDLVSIADIESRTGLAFFVNLVFSRKTKAIRDAKRAAFKAETARALWPVESAFYGVKCG